MKLIYTFMFAICCFGALAQVQLPLNENSKVAFIDIVKADSINEKLLFTNAKSWLVSQGYKIINSPQDSISGRLIASNELSVYARGYVSKKIHGKITYSTVIEVKNQKYRYKFDNFVFHYHKEDRNYKMVPSGKTKALEEENASGWQTLWESHKRITADHIAAQIRSLKATMVKLPKIKSEPVITKQSTKAEW